MIKLSIIIPARNEFSNIVHTVYSIIHSLETDGFTPQDYEIIIVNNCSDDEKYPQRGTGGTIDYLRTRGIYWNGILRTIYDPIAGNHSARNKGVALARGEYIFISDAHMAYAPHYFSELIRAIDESGGIVHGLVGWMGAYPHTKSGSGCSYTIKLGEEIKGTWNNYHLADDWWYIPALGHCSLGMKKQQFLDFGGYPEFHRCYGGGEFYVNMKWWMFGSSVAVNPKCIGYHLASGRGYSYNHDDYIHNIFLIGKSLGMDDWTERAYLNYLRRGKREIIDRMYQQAEEESKKDREFINKKKKFNFNDILVNRPWDKLNMERHGKANGQLLIYHDSWLNMLKEAPQYVQDLYNNSQIQKDLDKFINENLSQFVYKRNK